MCVWLRAQRTVSTVMGIRTGLLDGWETRGGAAASFLGVAPAQQATSLWTWAVARVGPFARSLETPLRPLRASWPLALRPVCWV